MKLGTALIAALLATASPGAAAPAAKPQADVGALPGGSPYAIDFPAKWNGTLLLWSHGYSQQKVPPASAPPALKEWLLAQGYALAGASYSQVGWAIEQAVPEQIATIEAFRRKYGRPKRVIAWGQSMGGLISVALAEKYPRRISAALPMCGSLSGSIGMMNEGLAAAFAFKVLLGDGAAIELVNVKDDRRNAQIVAGQVRQALATPLGRARLALVATLAQIPHWVDPDAAEPSAHDAGAVFAQQMKAVPFGVFLPRQDQERRAGGAFSWTDGIDFAALLDRSGERAYVQSFYQAAGVTLQEDLDTLKDAPRVHADSSAVRYMEANYSPRGELRVPMLAIHTIGDGVTVPANLSAYAALTAERGSSSYLRSAVVRGAGHCTFTPAEMGAALKALEVRVRDGRWTADPAMLNRLARETGLGTSRFTATDLPPFLTPYPAPGAAKGSK